MSNKPNPKSIWIESATTEEKRTVRALDVAMNFLRRKIATLSKKRTAITRNCAARTVGRRKRKGRRPVR